MNELIIFTGGGTGGHVFPGFAVIEELRDHRLPDVLWLGSRGGIEERLCHEWGIAFRPIPSGKLRRYLSFKNVSDLFRVGAGVISSLILLSRLKPRVLFSKGGYVSVPPVIAARLLGVPVVTHDSDFDPGLATRINARFAQAVLVPYEASAKFFPEPVRKRVIVTGNPVRRAIREGNAEEGARILGFAQSRPVVFFVGGSLGSARLNAAVASALPQLNERWNVVHQRGDHPEVAPESEMYRSRPFFAQEYAHILRAADVVICRAGAGTLWELAALAKPAILVPLGSGSSRGDQMRNAAIFEEAGAAVIIEESMLEQRLLPLLEKLFADSARRDSMGSAAFHIGRPDAARVIANMLYSFASDPTGS